MRRNLLLSLLTILSFALVHVSAFPHKPGVPNTKLVHTVIGESDSSNVYFGYHQRFAHSPLYSMTRMGAMP